MSNNNNLFIVPQFDIATITIPDSALQVRNAMVAQTSGIVSIANANEQAVAVNVLRSVKSTLKAVEATRKLVKQPFLDASRHVDKLANDHVEIMKTEHDRVLRLIDAFQKKEDERVAEEERRRNAEIARLAREAEEKRLEAERAAAAAQQPAPAADGQPVPSQQEEDDALKANLQLANSEEAVSAAAALEATIRSELPTVARAAGMMIRNEIVWEFTDKAEAYKHHPEFFELVEKRRVIKDTIYDETFTCPGMRVWKEKSTSVRV